MKWSFNFPRVSFKAMSVMRIDTNGLKAEVYNHRCEGYASYKEALRLPSLLWLLTSVSFLLSFKMRMRLRTRMYQALLVVVFAFNVYAFARFLGKHDENFGICMYEKSSETLRLISFLIEFLAMIFVFIYANSIHSKRVQNQ